MSLEIQVFKHSQLLHRRVIDRRTADDVGIVEQLWLDPLAHKVVGFTCKSGLLGRQKRFFVWQQIERIGDNILVSGTPDIADTEKPEGVLTTTGQEVCTDAGNKAGKLVDYLVIAQTGAVMNYLFSSSGWQGVLDGIYQFSPSAIASFGLRRIIVSEAAVLTPEKYAPGLADQVHSAADFAQKDYEATVDHWQNLRERNQAGVEGLKRGVRQIAEELQDKAQVVKEKVSEVKEQASEKVSEVRSKLKKPEPTPRSPDTLETKAAELDIDDDDDDF